MNIKLSVLILGLLLLMAGILWLVFNPAVVIAYPIALIGAGGYLFACGLSSLLLSRLYYADQSETAVLRNKRIRMLQTIVYVFLGLITLTTIILCLTLLT